MRLDAPGPGGETQPVTLSSPALAGLYKVRPPGCLPLVPAHVSAAGLPAPAGGRDTCLRCCWDALHSAAAGCAAQEAEVMARLRHPNVIPLVGICRWPPAIVSGKAGFCLCEWCRCCWRVPPRARLFPASPLLRPRGGTLRFGLQSTAPEAR